MTVPHPPFSCVSVVHFQCQKADLYCLWYSDDEKDAFFLKDSSLRTFPSQAAALKFLDSLSLPRPAGKGAQEAAVYDTVRIRKMLRGETPFDPAAALDFWNITGDLTRSLALPFLGSPGDGLTDSVYEKLFCGNNLPAVRTSDRLYLPQFSAMEKGRLNAVLEEGFRLIESLADEASQT